MKNYTAHMRLLDNNLSTPQVRKAIEDVLISDYPMIDFCLGEMAVEGNQILSVEIAINANKEHLVRRLEDLERNLPLHVEEVGWGWLITETKKKPLGSGKGHLLPDPYASVNPQDKASRRYYSGVLPFVLFLVFLGLAMGIVLVVFLSVANGIYSILHWESANKTPLLFFTIVQFINLCLFPTWVFFLMILRTPLWLSKGITYILCDDKGIEVKYWRRREPTTLKWAEIWGLDVVFQELVLHTNRHAQSIYMGNLGLGDTPILLKTIINRCHLHFVERIQMATYRRFDAPH